MTRTALIAVFASMPWTTHATSLQSQPSSDATWITFTLKSDLIPDAVDVGILLPPDYDPANEPLPLLVFLTSTSAQSLYSERAKFAAGWKNGTLPRMAVVRPSATRRHLFMDYRDGSQRWETFVLRDMLEAVYARVNVRRDREGTLIAGHSMGGLAALRIAFKHPDRFLAVGVGAAAIAPAYSYDALEAVDRWWPPATYETAFGTPVDDAYWQANNPLSIVKASADRLRRSALEICMAVGDEDAFKLYRGASALHRLLTDEGIKHEFHLVRGVDHASISDLYFLSFFDAVLARLKKLN